MVDGRTTDSNYKLTNEPKGSGVVNNKLNLCMSLVLCPVFIQDLLISELSQWRRQNNDVGQAVDIYCFHALLCTDRI